MKQERKAPQSPDDLLVEAQAAEILLMSVRTLQSWRCKEHGPPFLKIGRNIRYRYGDILEWLRMKTVRPEGPRS